MTKYNAQFKLEVIQFYLNVSYSFTKTSQHFQIPESIIKDWLAKYTYSGTSALQNQSTWKQYTADEKFQIITPVLSGEMSIRQAALKANLPTHSVVVNWLKRFKEQGITGLEPKPKGRKVMKTLIKPKKMKAPQTEIEKLQAENYRLKLENIYLKKLAELEQKEKKRKSSMS